MGLLTDPNAGQGRLTKNLIIYYCPLSIGMYICGLLWFFCISHPWINLQMYFSENALLPGLVKSDFQDDSVALKLYKEVVDEAGRYDDSLPYPWLLAKFRQIGLDTYTHNFTVNYPLGKRQKYTGKNVYGILRAARAASTEALVLSVPYRPSSSMAPPTLPSIAIMLAFAEFASKANYWSKDLIFVITEHEQLGMQAWLEAYHSVSCGEPGVLDHGELLGRGGAIQAAINMEIHDVDLRRVDMKIEGLNGQLPNLDLFNLCVRMCSKVELLHTFKNREKQKQSLLENWLYSFKTLMIMIFSQASGVPDGNHGLFLRFGIQAVTLEGFSDNRPDSLGTLKLGFVLEGVFRSLNNLLERFHQSYFFYLLSAPDRFISITLYMPIIGLMAGALLVRACGAWYRTYKPNSLDGFSNLLRLQKMSNANKESANVGKVLTCIALTHIYGCLTKFAPKILSNVGVNFGYSTEFSLYIGFLTLFLLSLSIPAFLGIRTSYKAMLNLKIISLVEFGTSIICLSMYNCSLGLLVGVVYVPAILLMSTRSRRSIKILTKVLWILVHPFVILTSVVIIYTFISFSGESSYDNIVRGIVATQQGVVYAVVDSMIYSNWLFNVLTCVIIPNWIGFWIVLFSPPKTENTDIEPNKKDN